ncbi:MAG TPA: hypothetical protein GXX49_04375 [Clostridiaceae bacterium]|jgi:hypothetical protein|nr:hypothetical protein [Clostridiaceae bacterium]
MSSIRKTGSSPGFACFYREYNGEFLADKLTAEEAAVKIEQKAKMKVEE